MSDGGGVNCNMEAKKIFIGRNILHQVAKVHIHFSNSMIEVVFRQLISKFLKRIIINGYDHLVKLIENFVEEYNSNIPHSVLNGATPVEVFNGDFCENKFKNFVKIGQSSALNQRQINNRQCINKNNCTKPCFT